MSAIGEFGGYLSATFPSQINLDVTEFCNLACVHCPYEAVTRPKGKKRQNLDPALHAKLVEEVRTEGRGHCRFVRYAGEGEPLLHPQIMEFLSTMASSDVLTALTTNGLLLTEERCRELIDANVAVVDVSLDAFKPETYAKIRVGGELKNATECVLRLFNMARAKNNKMKIMVSFIRQELNQGEEQTFEDFWKNQGLEHILVRNLHSCAGQKTDTAEMLWRAAPATRRPCVYPWERAVLKADGFMSYCPADWQHQTVIGHFAEHTLASLWQGDLMQKVRQAHATNDFSQHSFCGQCPDWSVTRWPNEGQTYATTMQEVERTRLAQSS